MLLVGCADGDPPAEVPGGPQIIVSGASGQLGGSVVDHLLRMGVDPGRLVLVSRTPEELDQYAAMGASTRFGDFTEPESLATAYEGGGRMLLISINTGLQPGPDGVSERQRLHRAAIDAAAAAGVDHIAYTSFVNATENPSPIASDHRATEQMLRDSGMAWTMLRNGLYMDGLVGRAAGMLEEGAVVVDQEEGTAYIAREDLAEAAATVLATEGHEGQTYELTGGEPISAATLAEIASEVAGRPVEIETAADPEDGVGLSTPGGETVTDHFARLTGHPPMTLRELLQAKRADLVD